jgi:hypothetical protein
LRTTIGGVCGWRVRVIERRAFVVVVVVVLVCVVVVVFLRERKIRRRAGIEDEDEHD